MGHLLYRASDLFQFNNLQTCATEMGLLFFFRRNATQVYNWAWIASGTAKEKDVEVMQLKDQGVPGVSPASSTKMTSDPTSGIISSCASSRRASTIWKEIIRNTNARPFLTFISVNHVFCIKHYCAVKLKFTVIHNTRILIAPKLEKSSAESHVSSEYFVPRDK